MRLMSIQMIRQSLREKLSMGMSDLAARERKRICPAGRADRWPQPRWWDRDKRRAAAFMLMGSAGLGQITFAATAAGRDQCQAEYGITKSLRPRRGESKITPSLVQISNGGGNSALHLAHGGFGLEAGALAGERFLAGLFPRRRSRHVSA